MSDTHVPTTGECTRRVLMTFLGVRGLAAKNSE